ncbi:hypothetical protein BN1049_02302 [Pseudomonas saudimassiliensis]|uniref:Uncharacterized protein n=1 Tax=Pseudomonas saudimassiliensis TaxID=1461581 RepID=A0A078MHP1_9PSED|nr:hypothetical protein [Pseudomonas saudimassiliensis]CEA05845.1 hypothetical protein BN1049_02302 [Pseudomonas saudimassiliensis]CEF27354.1 hypothetical protein BN1049_02302 [Pseudomonas saudimassiliensis]
MKPLIIIPSIDQFSARATSDEFEIKLDVEGREHALDVSSNFALWLTLPIAMATGRDLHIEGTVSPLALHNAHILVDIWSKWLPTLFSTISISARETSELPGAANRDSTLMLFSGGLDSSYSLFKNFIIPKKPVSLLTVHGMDYKTKDTNRFQELIEKTRPLTSEVTGSHYFVRSNAAEVMSQYGIGGGISHGFHLFGNLFLFEDQYQSGAIASDCSLPLEFVIAPWGTNHITNKLFTSGHFFVQTLDNDVDRSQKAGSLLKMDSHPQALHTVSFCKDYESRPHNCGVCSKCVRTKAMFYTETGEIPDVFLNRAFEPEDVGIIDITKRGEKTFVLDLLASARRNGKEDEFSWLSNKVKSSPAKASLYEKIKKLLKK